MVLVKGDLTSRLTKTNSLAVGVTKRVSSPLGQAILDYFSTNVQVVTGTASSFTYKFMAATLAPSAGYQFTIYNKNSQQISVLDSENEVIVTIPSGYAVIITLRDNTTAKGVYDVAALSNTSFSDVSAGQTALFGRSGLVLADTWLLINGVPSNSAGFRTSVTTARVVRLFTNTGVSSTYSVGLYAHDGNLVNSSLISTLNVVGDLGAETTPSINVASGKQLAIKILSGSVTDVLAGVVLKGLI